MKKILFMFMMMCATFAFAQVDNVSIQAGAVTPFNDFCKNGSVTPIISVSADKYVTPWLGVGIDGRTSIGTGTKYNPHTAFDAVNVSGYAKINVLNAISYYNERRFFEPVVYTGLGWGHWNCSNVAPRNYMTYRAGVECNFNLCDAWGIVVNPSVVWGDIDNGKLVKQRGNFEVTAGVVYHFKNSNGKRTFVKPRLYDAAEVAMLMDKISKLESRKPEIVEKVVVKEVNIDRLYRVGFAQNSAELTDAAKSELNRIPKGSNVTINSSVSPEGTYKRNSELIILRTQAVSDYLTSRGVNCRTVVVDDSRQSIITIE